MSRLFLLTVMLLSAGYNLFAQDIAKVRKVMDSGTLEVDYEGQKETIHLLGVNTPNSGAEDSKGMSSKYIDAMKEREKKALSFTKSLVKKGDSVLIDFDESKWDKNHRLVAYVYFNNGKMLNEEIIAAGYAGVSFEPPNTRFQNRFRKDCQEARAKRIGLWK